MGRQKKLIVVGATQNVQVYPNGKVSEMIDNISGYINNIIFCACFLWVRQGQKHQMKRLKISKG